MNYIICLRLKARIVRIQSYKPHLDIKGFETPIPQIPNTPKISNSQIMTAVQSLNLSPFGPCVRTLDISQLALMPNKVRVAKHATSHFKIGFYGHFVLCSSQQPFEISILIIWFKENKTKAFPRQKWQLDSDFLMSSDSLYLLYHILILLKLFEELTHTEKMREETFK